MFKFTYFLSNNKTVQMDPQMHTKKITMKKINPIAFLTLVQRNNLQNSQGSYSFKHYKKVERQKSCDKPVGVIEVI